MSIQEQVKYRPITDKNLKVFNHRVKCLDTLDQFRAAVGVEAYSDLKKAHITVLMDQLLFEDMSKSRPVKGSFRHLSQNQAYELAAAIVNAALTTEGRPNDWKWGAWRLKEAQKSL